MRKLSIITSIIIGFSIVSYGQSERKYFKNNESISGNSYLKTGSFWTDYSKGNFGSSIFTSIGNFMSMKWIGKSKKIKIYHLNPTADFKKRNTVFKIISL